MTMSVIQTMVSHVMVTDIQYNYNMSCRLMPVCFELKKLLVLDNLLHIMYSKVRYSTLWKFWFSQQCCWGLVSSRTWCYVTGQVVLIFWTIIVPSNSRDCLPNNTPHVRSLESFNLHYARKELSCVELFIPTIPKNYTYILVYWCSQT
jgi:hypothetical protein